MSLRAIAASWMCLAAASLAGSARAQQGPPTRSLEEIRECARANVPDKSAVQSVDLKTTDRLGGSRTLDARIYWKPTAEGLSRVLVQVEGPANVRGSAYLVLETEAGKNEMFTYLPEFGRVRRIQSDSAGGSLFGTDFTYEDFIHLQQGASSAKSEKLPDTEIDGHGAHVIAALPAPDESSAYAKVLSFIDRETCVPLKIEFYAHSGDLLKVLTADPATISREGSFWVPHAVTLKDLKNETQTDAAFRKVEFDEDVPDRLFSVSHLERGR